MLEDVVAVVALVLELVPQAVSKRAVARAGIDSAKTVSFLLLLVLFFTFLFSDKLFKSFL